MRNPGFLDGQIATKDLIKKYLYPCRDFMKLNKDYFERREISDFVRIIEDPERRINNPETVEELQNVNRRMFMNGLNNMILGEEKTLIQHFRASSSLRSFVKMYDIVFQAITSPNAEENFTKLYNRFNSVGVLGDRVKRIENVKGIPNALYKRLRLLTLLFFCC